MSHQVFTVYTAPAETGSCNTLAASAFRADATQLTLSAQGGYNANCFIRSAVVSETNASPRDTLLPYHRITKKLEHEGTGNTTSTHSGMMVHTLDGIVIDLQDKDMDTLLSGGREIKHHNHKEGLTGVTHKITNTVKGTTSKPTCYWIDTDLWAYWINATDKRDGIAQDEYRAAMGEIVSYQWTDGKDNPVYNALVPTFDFYNADQDLIISDAKYCAVASDANTSYMPAGCIRATLTIPALGALGESKEKPENTALVNLQMALQHAVKHASVAADNGAGAFIKAGASSLKKMAKSFIPGITDSVVNSATSQIMQTIRK
jgi:hypothetical protein